MKLNSLTLSIVIILGLAIALGIGAKYITGDDDSATEETAESVIENTIENALGLDGGSLDGKIDLSPSTPEK